jgi:hypothetical protein
VTRGTRAALALAVVIAGLTVAPALARAQVSPSTQNPVHLGPGNMPAADHPDPIKAKITTTHTAEESTSTWSWTIPGLSYIVIPKFECAAGTWIKNNGKTGTGTYNRGSENSNTDNLTYTYAEPDVRITASSNVGFGTFVNFFRKYHAFDQKTQGLDGADFVYGWPQGDFWYNNAWTDFATGTFKISVTCTPNIQAAAFSTNPYWTKVSWDRR